MTLSRYHARIRKEHLWCIAIETICEALRNYIVFNEPELPWWLHDDRRAA